MFRNTKFLSTPLIFAQTTIFKNIFKQLSIFVFALSFLTHAYGSKEEPTYQLIKVSSEEEIAPLENETYGVARSIFRDFENDYDPDGPFGIYRLVVNRKTVGYQSIYPVNTDGGEVTSFIFEPYRGQGCGTALRRLVCQHVDQFIGVRINLSSAGGLRISSLPFRYLSSYNAWHWGANGATLASALKAGYGVAGLQGHESGMVLLFYPRLTSSWDDKRVNTILEFSRLNGQYDQPQTCADLMIKLITGLNLTQHRHVATTCAVICHLKILSAKAKYFDQVITGFLEQLDKPNVDMLNAFVNRGCSSIVEQDIPDTWLYVDQPHLSTKVQKTMRQLLQNLHQLSKV